MPPQVAAKRSATSAGPRPAAPSTTPQPATTSRSANRPSAAPALRLSTRPASGRGGGQPIEPSIRPKLEQSLGVELSGVRVHSDAHAQRVAAEMSARAVTYGSDIFLAKGERGSDIALIGHEVAHVVQQAATPAAQPWTALGGDHFEHEAQAASAAVARGDTFTVEGRTSTPRVQRLGISDALDFFARQANNIPGFRMFTIILGVNPINMSRVERNAANVMRAVVEFMPGGGLITQALDTYGIFDRAGAWVDQQINSLGMTGTAIRTAVMEFVNSLSFGDIFDLDGVWERAKRIFTAPIRRIIDFVVGLVTGILRFIKDAILMPLARLAEGTRGYDLLKAVLGQDPITGEAVPRNAETLIGGFMKLIGQEDVWENIKRGNAIARAWGWFQGALQGLMGFVRQVPQLFISALQSLEIVDLVLVPRAFAKVANVFGGFIGQFLSWAGQQVMSLLQIIFEVVAPSVMPYIQKAAGAFRTIVQNPIGFIGNLVRAGIQGFQQFGRNFLTHLRTSLIQWLTGAMSGANIYIPQAFTLREIIKFVLSVLGLTWQNIRGKLVRAIGETAVTVLETTFDIVVTLVREGPAAAWEKIKEQLTNLREMVMEQIMNFVATRIVQAAITKLVTSLNPAGAFIQAIIAIYNTVMFLVERLRQIAQVVASFIDSIAAIAAGNIASAANRVEQTMGGLLTLVISFLARLIGLGRVSDAVTNIINRIRQPIDRALDRVVEWIVNTAKRIGSAIMRTARGAASRIAGWLGLRKQFRVGSESHSLAFDQGARTPTLVLATTPVHMGSWVRTRETELRTANQLDTPKQAAIRGIDRDLAALGRLTYPREGTAAPPVADQERDVNQLLDALAGNVATVGFSGDMVPVPRMVVTPGFSSAKAANTTVQFLFNDQHNHQSGTPTSGRESLGGAWDKLAELGISRMHWKSGHMLNVKFGGPNQNSNLIPVPTTVNNEQEGSFDTKIEQDLYIPKKVIWMRFSVSRGHAGDPEGHFVSHYKAEAAEMPLQDNRYQVPTGGIVSFERSGTQLPYPARRVSALTINDLIRNRDTTQESIRSVSGATQLEERLVRALVDRGVVLNGPDDIVAFIDSSYDGLRASRYKANLQRVRSSLVL